MLEGSLWLCLLKATAEHDSSCRIKAKILSANPKILVYTALRRDSDQEQSG